MKRFFYIFLMLIFVILGYLSSKHDLLTFYLGLTVVVVIFSLVAKKNVALTLLFTFALASVFFLIPETAKAGPSLAPDVVTIITQEEPTTNCAHQYTENIKPWCGLIEANARVHSLDPFLIAAVMTQESGGNPNAYSSAGAVGLMQVMPSDGISAGFQCINGPCFSNRPTTAELLDPSFNIDYGSGMLERLITHNNGDIREALFNYGPSGAGYTYADKVIAIYERIRISP